jgi:MFS family permease
VATRVESNVVYAAGLVQGVALVTFPAASTVFMDPATYGLSNTQYGAMFLPQAAFAIAASVVGVRLAARSGPRRLYLWGLVGDLAAMALLVVSQFLTENQAVAYAMLLIATACLGAGFGFAVPALNTLAAVFHDRQPDRAVLTLNALLGLGTALAPVFVAIFVGLGFWWGLPVLVAAAVSVLFVVSARLPLRAEIRSTDREKVPLPPRFWLFALFSLLYGVAETMNGNWARRWI